MTASSHLSIPAGLTLYTFRPHPDLGEEDLQVFLDCDESARDIAIANRYIRALNEVSGRVVFEAVQP